MVQFWKGQIAIVIAMTDHSKTEPLEIRSSKCLVFQCSVFKPPLYIQSFYIPIVIYLGKGFFWLTDGIKGLGLTTATPPWTEFAKPKIVNESVVCCCKLNNTQDCDEHLFGQVKTHTGRYQPPLFCCTILHQQISLGASIKHHLPPSIVYILFIWDN